MKIRIFSSVLVGGVWHEPGIGNYSPELAEHLIGLGVAEKYETKVVEEIITKVDVKKTLPPPSLSVSPPAQVSRGKTAKKSGKAALKP